MSAQMKDRPTLLGMAAAIAIGCVLLVFAAEGVLRVAMPQWREFYSGRFVRVVDVPNHVRISMGRPRFDGYFAQNNGDFRVRIRINDFGLRNPEPVNKAAGRVWFVGDSMTFGWGVEQNEMYSSVAGTLLNAPTYNVASPGTDVCGYQTLLAITLKHASPRAVIVGLILENDLGDYDCKKAAREGPRAYSIKNTAGGERVVAVDMKVRQFLMKNTALYNFFAVSLKRVTFINEALIGIGLIKKGHIYKPANTKAGFDKVIRRTAGELANLKTQLPARIPLAVLIAPARFEIRDGDPAYKKGRLEMVRELASLGISVIDPIEEFLAAGFQPTHFAHDGHWSVLGHKIAARAVANWLSRQNIGN